MKKRIKEAQTITYMGETKSLAEWAKTFANSGLNLNENCLRKRLSRGMPVEEIFTKPNERAEGMRRRCSKKIIETMIHAFTKNRKGMEAWFADLCEVDRDKAFAILRPFLIKQLEGDIKTEYQAVAKQAIEDSRPTYATIVMNFNSTKGAVADSNVIEI